MRVENWPTRMAEALETAKKKGFKRGKLDCCLFSADIVKAITGVDYAASFRDCYTTRAGAAAALKKFGAGTIRKTVTEIIGEEISLRAAGRGDLVLANQGNGNMLGICVGDSASFLTRNGLAFIKMKSCLTAWRVA